MATPSSSVGEPSVIDCLAIAALIAAFHVSHCLIVAARMINLALPG